MGLDFRKKKKENYQNTDVVGIDLRNHKGNVYKINSPQIEDSVLPIKNENNFNSFMSKATKELAKGQDFNDKFRKASDEELIYNQAKKQDDSLNQKIDALDKEIEKRTSPIYTKVKKKFQRDLISNDEYKKETSVERRNRRNHAGYYAKRRNENDEYKEFEHLSREDREKAISKYNSKEYQNKLLEEYKNNLDEETKKLIDTKKQLDNLKVFTEFQKNAAEQKTKKTTTLERVLEPVFYGAKSLLNDIRIGNNKYIDESGKVKYLPTKDELKHQRVLDSYNNAIGKVYNEVVSGTTKILGSQAINSATFDVGGSVIYFGGMTNKNYKESINKGANNNKAIVNAVTKTGLEFLTGKFLGSATKELTGGTTSQLENFISNKMYSILGGNATISRLLGSIGSEGLEEFTQAPLEHLIDLGTLGKDGDNKTVWAVLKDKDVWGDALTSGLIGGVTGGLVSGINMSFNNNEAKVVDSLNMFKDLLLKDAENFMEKGNIEKANEFQKLADTITEKLKKPFTDRDENINLYNESANKLLDGFREENQLGNKIDIKDENIKNVSENIQNEFADSINVDNREIGLKNLEFLDSAKNYGIDTETETFKLLEGFISKRGIKAKFNDKAFTNNNTNGLWGISKNGERFVLFNPNSTTEQRVEATIVHETFHDIVSQGHGQDIINMVMKNASTKEDFQKSYNNLKKTYENAGYNIKDKVYFENLIKEEATASILGQKLGNEEFISEALKNKTVFDKIYSIVVSISNFFNGLTGYKNEKLMWQDIKNKYTKYYNQKGNIVDSDVKFSKAKLNNGADVVISDEVLGRNPRINEVKEHLEKMIGKEYFNASSKKIIGIEKTDINKYIHDGYNNYKNTKLKKRIVGNYGEILELSKISSNKANEKGTNRGVDGFDYYKCYLAYPIRDNSQNIVNYKVYSGRLVVRKEPNGNFAYDLDNFSYKKGLTVDKTSLSIYTGQSPEISKSSYENNLQQKDEIVNNVMKSVTSKSVQEVDDLKNREIAKKILTKEDEDKLGKALYILNKKAKEGRDLSQYLYETRKKVNFKVNFNDAPVFLKDELEKRGYEADDDGDIAFFDKFGKKYNTKNEVDEVIDENQRSIDDLEYLLENDKEEYDEEQIVQFEEELEFYKEYEEDLENVKEKIENLKDDIRDIDLDYHERQKSLYHLKEEVLKNYEPLGYHYFPGKVWYDEEGVEHGGEDPYAYYKIGKWSFHNKVNNWEKLYGLKEIGSIGDQISSENKVDDMTYDEAKEIVINYLKADTKLSKKSPTWQEFLDKNYPSTGKGKTMKEIRESALVNFGKKIEKSPYNVPLEKEKTFKEKANIYTNKKTEQGAHVNGFLIPEAVHQSSVHNNTMSNSNKKINSDILEQNGIKIHEEQNDKKSVVNTENNSNKEISHFVNNIEEQAHFINDELKEKILKDDNVKYYKKLTNKETMGKAFNTIKGNIATSYSRWLAKDKNWTAEDVGQGWIYLKHFQDIGDTDNAVLVARKMREMGTKSGQAIQMYNVMSRLTPEGMYKFAVKELDEAWENAIKDGKKSKKWREENYKHFTLTPEESNFIKTQMEKIQGMKTGRAKDIELAKIQKMLQNKLPHKKGASLKAWMRISMLLNPKTLVRNTTGNAIMLPVNAITDFIASKVDKKLSSYTGQRTIGTYNVKEMSKGAKKGLFESYEDFKLEINTRDINGNRFEIGEGKSFNEKHIGLFAKQRNSLAKVLNRVDFFLGFALDAGDRPFYEAVFINSINNQLVLNNTDVATQDMIDIATEEALQRTWQDNNKYTKLVLSFRRGLNRIGYFGDVLIPFAKTPANLTKAIVDYSPLGAFKAWKQYHGVKNAIEMGELTVKQQHEFAQTVGKMMAGTFIYFLGGILASKGILKGKNDEDKDVADFMRNTMGIQPYSFKIGNKSFTYDWAQPVAAPLAIMADTFSEQNKDLSFFESLFKSSDAGFNVLLEQSFLKGVSTILNPNTSTTERVAQAYLDLSSRFVPTASKQLNDLIQPNQKITYERKKIFETAKNKTLVKIPFADGGLADKRDALGRKVEKYGGENNLFNVFLNPANVNKGKPSEAGKEIYEVYLKIKDKKIFPRRPSSQLHLTPHEESEFLRVSGGLIENNINKLKDNEEYKKLSYEDKGEVISGIVNYSYTKAKEKITNKKSRMSKKLKNGYPVVDYYLGKIERRRND